MMAQPFKTMWRSVRRHGKEAHEEGSAASTTCQSTDLENVPSGSSSNNGHNPKPTPGQQIMDKVLRQDSVEFSSENDSVATHEVEQQEPQAEVFHDAVEAEPRFPLTMAPRHQFVDVADFRADRTDLRNSYSEPPATDFQVRGPNYLSKSGKNMKDLKVPSEPTPYEVIGVNMFHCDRRIKHSADEIGDLRRYLQNHPTPADKDPNSLPSFLIINWIMSPLFGRECWVVNHVYRLKPQSQRTPDAALDHAFARFIKGSDAEKNTQFKYMFRIVDAPGPLRSTVSALGGERPVIIGKSLTTTYNRGSNYLEVNMDVSSSRIASAINGMLLKNMQSAVCDCAWLLEGQREDELPERLLATVRWNWNCVEEVVVNLDLAGERL